MNGKLKLKNVLAGFLALTFVMAAGEALASHFRQADISWERVSGRTVKIKVRQAWRVSSGSFELGDGSRVNLGSLISTPTDLAGFQYRVYSDTITHTYSSDGPFTIRLNSCCRIGGLSTSGSSFKVETTVDLRGGQNGSPVISLPPILQLPKGPNNFQIAVADPDGGAITCRQATSSESFINSSPPGFSVTNDCRLVWDTTNIAHASKWAVQVIAFEGGGRTANDFIIEVNGGLVNNDPPTCQVNGSVLNTVAAGTPFSISLTGTDPEGEDLRLNILNALPAGATLTPGNGAIEASPATATFNWTPTTPGTSTAISLSFTDPSSQSVACSFSVSVPANQPPTANAGSDQTVEQADATGSNVVLGGTGTDPENDPLTFSWSGPFGTASGQNPTVLIPAGTHTVTLVVNDGTVDSAPSTVQITVQDTTAPAVTAPADITVEATAPLSPVAINTATTTDAVGVTSGPTADNTGPYPVGTTVVTWSASDAVGNIGTATQNVTVVDTTAPAVTVPADVSVEATAPLSPVVINTATATDAVGVTSGPTADNTGPYPVGTTVVTWSASDAVGNTGTATQNVTVVDTTAPAVPAPADVTVDATGSLTPVSLVTPNATDAVGVVSLANDAPAAGYPVDSTTTVTWTAIDAAGNTTTVSLTVTVRPFDLGVAIGKTKLKIHRGHDHDKDKDKDNDKHGSKDWLQIAGTLTEFSNGDGLNFLSDPVTITLNGFTWNLPPGSFVLKTHDSDKDKDGDHGVHYKYKGGRTGLTEVKVDGNGKFKLKVKRMDLSGLSFGTPIPFSVTVGNDFGETDVTFNTRRGKDDDKDKDHDKGKKK